MNGSVGCGCVLSIPPILSSRAGDAMPNHRQPTISTHVLDNERGQPAVGVRVVLERRDGDHFVWLADGLTDADGRIGSLLPGALLAGVYRISFAPGSYFA